jgi:hypothetical protein
LQYYCNNQNTDEFAAAILKPTLVEKGNKFHTCTESTGSNRSVAPEWRERYASKLLPVCGLQADLTSTQST